MENGIKKERKLCNYFHLEWAVFVGKVLFWNKKGLWKYPKGLEFSFLVS
jgi:hypothetical protein